MRIIRACREMGIASVAVYSDVDRAALHVSKADEAYHIGPPQPRVVLKDGQDSRCRQAVGAEAIHPGYGFLSENARFAQSLREAGIKFIGRRRPRWK